MPATMGVKMVPGQTALMPFRVAILKRELFADFCGGGRWWL
jgi:hypothetical protein